VFFSAASKPPLEMPDQLPLVIHVHGGGLILHSLLPCHMEIIVLGPME
jgi:acetyl esterase/lipase